MNRFRFAASFGAVAAIAGAATLSAVVGCAASSSGGPINTGEGGRGGASGTGTGGGSSGTGGSGVGIDAGAGAGGRTTSVDGGSDAGSPGGATGAGGASGGCFATVTQISPPPSAVEAGPKAKVRVQATPGGIVPSPVIWDWTVVSDMQDAGTITPTAIDGAGAIVEFPVAFAARYLVTATISNRPGCRPGTLSVTAADLGAMQYLLRATAPGFPVQDTPFPLGATDPQMLATLALNKGTNVMLSPQRTDMNGGPLASYVRVTDPGSGVSVDADTTRGAAMVPLIPTLSYDLLIVPSEAYAPIQMTGLPSSWLLQLDQGVPVSATTVDSVGNPVVGVRMVLRRGSVPSTVGVSDSTGTATLWARASTSAMSMNIVPPIGSGLPSAAVGDGSDLSLGPGIMIALGVTSASLSMKWDHVTTAPLTVHVLAPGGAMTGAGARVRATAKAAAGPVGTLTVQSPGGTPVPLRPIGTTDVEVATDTTGAATFTALPVGAYTITVIPASNGTAPTASSLATTTAAVTLGSGGLTSNVTLSMKSTLTGMLLPLSDSPGTQIIAIDRGVTASGTVVSATVAADGTYQLFVDPGRSYELLAQPPPTSARGRAVLALSVSDATPTLATATLPMGHAVHGTVTAALGGALGGTLVQAFCPTTSSRCLDGSLPLAETLARFDGTFDLILPDPPTN
jgi:hypothetical protein